MEYAFAERLFRLENTLIFSRDAKPRKEKEGGLIFTLIRFLA
jgi:hypothetical protein